MIATICISFPLSLRADTISECKLRSLAARRHPTSNALWYLATDARLLYRRPHDDVRQRHRRSQNPLLFAENTLNAFDVRHGAPALRAADLRRDVDDLVDLRRPYNIWRVVVKTVIKETSEVTSYVGFTDNRRLKICLHRQWGSSLFCVKQWMKCIK